LDKDFVENLLSGQTLTVGAIGESGRQVGTDGQNNSRVKNFYLDMWSKLSQLGNFSVKWVYDTPTGDESDTQFLMRYAKGVDVVGSASYYDTVDRREGNLIYVHNPG
jgi:hypothetical protein